VRRARRVERCILASCTGRCWCSAGPTGELGDEVAALGRDSYFRFPAAPAEAAERGHPTGRNRMDSFTLSTLQDPILQRLSKTLTKVRARDMISNLQATAAVLLEAQRRNIPRTHVICTGDVVAYCADPQQTVEAVRAAGVVVLQGNCEASLGQRAVDCGCGFDAGSACSLLAVAWYGESMSPTASPTVSPSPCRGFDPVGRRSAGTRSSRELSTRLEPPRHPAAIGRLQDESFRHPKPQT
jgi:hypothetical protein